MSDGQTFIFLMTALGCTSLVTLGIVRAVIGSRRKKDQGVVLDAGISDRLGRMEQAIDAIAIEVERVSESQRFVTKLLAERQAPVASIPERVITPH
ncbi:MAG: hypothetical protein ACRENQ_12785 [Gemmatimonadaceae bacterium]